MKRDTEEFYTKCKKLYSRAIFTQLDMLLAELNMVKQFSHSLEKGREAEGILMNFLKNMIPSKYEIGTGFAASEGNVSTQLDIMIYNKMDFAPLYTGFYNKIIPIHSLFATIESKMELNNKLLNDCCFASKTLKEIFRNTLNIFQKSDEDKQSLTEPIYIVFAYESPRIETIVKNLKSHEEKTIDIIVSLEHGCAYLDKSKNEYWIRDKSSYLGDWHVGRAKDGMNVEMSHHYFLHFYSQLMAKIEHFKTCPPDYLGWQQLTSLYSDE